MFELGTDGPNVLLVAVDGSETSLRAAAYAAGLARRQGSKLVVLFVHTLGATGISPEATTAVRFSNNAVAEELRAAIAEQAPRLGVDVTLVEREGNPFAEIVRLAEERRVDAVIVGASTKAGHRLIGSLAVHLVKDARWPVTVVP
ncbi:universal stress protein [Jatrophihabitans sp. DSM 45814]